MYILNQPHLWWILLPMCPINHDVSMFNHDVSMFNRDAQLFNCDAQLFNHDIWLFVRLCCVFGRSTTTLNCSATKRDRPCAAALLWLAGASRFTANTLVTLDSVWRDLNLLPPKGDLPHEREQSINSPTRGNSPLTTASQLMWPTLILAEWRPTKDYIGGKVHLSLLLSFAE